MKKKYLNSIRILILIFLSQNISAQIPLTNSVYESQINSYLDEVKTQYSLTTNDFSDLMISKEHYSSKTKITHLYLVQRYQNIEIFNSETSIAIKDNKVFYYANRLQPDVLGKVNKIVPSLSAEQAIKKVAIHFKLQSPGSLEILESNNNNKEIVFSNGGISQENIPAKLVFLLKDGQLRLSWDISIYTLNSKHWWSVRVDALTGEILDINDWVVSCNFDTDSHVDHNHKVKKNDDVNSSFMGLKNTLLVDDGSQYSVFPLPAESPNHGGMQIVNNPADDVASPFGWHDTDGTTGAEFTVTRGNNVFAKDDINGDNFFGSSPDGGATLNFNFPYNFNTHPINMLEATTVNLFYMNNMMHDIWYHYGFDEASGNFQENNYGNGGVGGDSVIADAQDGSGTNNANFSTPPEGSKPRIQMFLWSASGPPGQPLTINGGPLAGDYTAIPAGFGPPLPATALTADIVLLEDNNAGTSTDTNDACDPITNGGSLNGKIAVIRRGDCEFGFKVLAAQAEGAIAVIMVNNVPGAPISMGPGEDGGGVSIPSIMVSQTDGDAIIAELQSAATVNGSLIEKPPFSVDGDLDNGIIAHEYGHGISTRLTGGSGNSNCLNNNEQMGEGWSDWFGLMITMKPSDLPETGRGIGTYAIGQDIDGAGIRPARYSTDFNVNNFTYNATNDVTVLGQDVQGNDIIWNEIVHNIGFVWATVIWDLTWAYVDKYGFDPDLYNGTGGNNKVMQIVIDGLKLQPCNPGFVDGRDAILAADLANGGEDQCMIWEVFAARGLGVGASQGDAISMTDQVEDFAMPDAGDASLANCTTLSTEDFILKGYSIYPNPSSDKLFIKTSVDFGEVKMSMIDLNGRIVLTKKVDLFGGGEVDVDISRLQSGIYILNIKGQDININSKIIKD